MSVLCGQYLYTGFLSRYGALRFADTNLSGRGYSIVPKNYCQDGLQVIDIRQCADY